MKGVYVLILLLRHDAEINAGKPGSLNFRTGYYAYTGSAGGAGGFKRVKRHFNVASGKNKTRKWHIDHLLPLTDIVCAVLMPTDDKIECSVASALGGIFEGIMGFGCSDCDCNSHLFFSETDMKEKIIKTCDMITGSESIIIYPNSQESF